MEYECKIIKVSSYNGNNQIDERKSWVIKNVESDITFDCTASSQLREEASKNWSYNTT